MRNTIIICLLGAVVGVGGTLFYMSIRSRGPSTETVVPQTQQTTSPTVEQFITSAPDTSILKAGGSSYSDPTGVFGFLYPNDYVLNTSDKQHIRISKKGATQKGQTELYDGVLLVFESVDLQDQPLEAWVDARIQDQISDGSAEVTAAKKAVLLNTNPGFTYEIRGLGTSTTLVVQKSSNSTSAVSITYIAPDPQGKGYISEVDAILSTLDLRK